MKLIDVVEAIVLQHGITDRDIIEIVTYLVREDICSNANTVKKMAKILNESVRYDS